MVIFLSWDRWNRQGLSWFFPTRSRGGCDFEYEWILAMDGLSY